MNEYINLTLENIDEEHICCAIGDKKHQAGVDSKKEWIKSKLKDGHIFRKLNTRGKIFIEYEPIETAWIPISGKNYEYIYCLWVAGSFKGNGIGKELLEYAIKDSKEKGKSGICTLVSKKKKPFIGEKKFFEHYGFKVVDTIGDYELLALQFDDSETPRFNDNARTMKIDNQDFTIYYSNECPYVEYEVNELTEYAKENNINVICKNKFLTEEEYEEEIYKTDVILLPYRKIFTGNSGPMTDGIYADKFILGPNNGNLGYLIKKYNLGSTFIQENCNDLAREIEKISQVEVKKTHKYKYELSIDKFNEKYTYIYNYL